MQTLEDAAREELEHGPTEGWLARAGREVAAAVRDGGRVPDLEAVAGLVEGHPAWTAAVAALRAVLAAAEVPQLTTGSPAARLLRAVAGFPGSSAADLAALCLLDDAGFAAASGELLRAGLVTATRFDVPDCWVRTERGRRAAALLPEGERQVSRASWR